MKKKNKISLSLILSMFFLFTSLIQNVYAEDIYVNAISSIALDCDSKLVLYEKNAFTPIEIASTTKIITCLVAIKCGDLNKKIVVSEKAASIRGSEIGLKVGEEITLKELLYGLMLRSGNDAAIAISEGVSGSVDEFLKLMNEYALEIGLLNSNFESPHGLDSSNHYSTAYDLALVTAKAKEIKLFNDIVSSKDIDAKEYGFNRSYHNINKILYLLPNATGVKTGFTGKAGKCLVTSVKIQNREVIIITLNCTLRWKETEKISKYIEKNYEYKKVISKDDTLESLNIKNGASSVQIASKGDIIIPIKKDENIEIKIKKPLYEIIAPVQLGEKLGRVDIYSNNKLLFTQALVAKNSVARKNMFRQKLDEIVNFIIPSK
ncbi:D-alanyl-D-alanine carboxypeptidase [Clostridium tagluense]|uniref:D-alanyl-D-alanine carboxypeptidase family protein n=1 Tax=Clostridium tagluense TaxID=360422 RepID=UPI001C0AFA44|nr:D-alanyl-D-alanine carboxypeptidase family protein [Clostridium tagluense]MBU3126552.1 D-alanyl-D-alanine carboxypeptidase [Clostridium tagluense]MCB2309920.1 D-alanyl-D-alanine carboxypeptidase [Clostridium tagluense]MCB2314550.1 D-alanyl-D-alanine carboxypeptidase [Clostridium tagluense]MCB2319398.1 D-alanyl-D-alanine carboxypeptidase [Clostridium tagluense]MCB2324514.1 D-alanyl-D-alanine carboxypeptidase [Clostridium tagluense]